MTVRERQVSAGALVMIAGAGTLTVYLYWHVLVNAAVCLLAGRIAFLILARKAGIRRRPKSSWSSLIRSLSIAFAAWNTRYFKPRVEAKIRANVDGIPKPDPDYGDVPF